MVTLFYILLDTQKKIKNDNTFFGFTAQKKNLYCE